jgi:hypothetical protein
MKSHARERNGHKLFTRQGEAHGAELRRPNQFDVQHGEGERTFARDEGIEAGRTLETV